jgi:hypothetical protein
VTGVPRGDRTNVAPRDWSKASLVTAIAGWLVAFYPAVLPIAIAFWSVGLLLGIIGRRRSRNGYGLAGLIASALGLAYVLLGVTLGMLLF